MTSEPVPFRRCARCGKPTRTDRMIKGFGRDCAAFLGLTGTAPDTGHDGPDLLDLLADAPNGYATSQDTTSAGRNADVRDDLRWIRSTTCSNNTCVEVADAGADVLVRDGKNPDQPHLSFDRPVWHEFLDGVTAGDFQEL